MLKIICGSQFYWVIVWALGFYALLIIYCQISGRAQHKTREQERERVREGELNAAHLSFIQHQLFY